MQSRVYNPITETYLSAFRRELPHAVLLDGAPGMGLLSTARDIAGKNLSGIVNPTDAKGNSDPDGSIKIDQIRMLYDQTKSKSAGRQVFVIDDADRMVAQAQHALLKLLEEPSPHIHFILTAHSHHKILPTILSRVQRVTVRALSTAQSVDIIRKLGLTDETAIQQIQFIAAGRPALLTSLAMSPSALAASAQLMQDARALLQGTATDKLRVIHEYGSDRVQALQVIEAALAIITYSVKRAPSQAQLAIAAKFTRAHDRITANGAVKLQLLLVVL